MKKLYVVKRPFKSVGIAYAIGSIIEDPTAVRLFKTKLREGKVIEVNEANLGRIAEYVQSKTGVNPKELFSEQLEKAKQIADEEAKRLADEEEAKRIADEEEKLKIELAVKVEALQLELPDGLTIIEVQKAIEEAEEAKRIADEEEAKRLAEESKKVVKVATVTVNTKK